MHRSLALLTVTLFAAIPGFADSILISGSRQSILVSGQEPTAPTTPLATPAPVPAAPPVTPPPAPVPVPAAQPAAAPAPQTERWLVSESWCPHCPAAKRAFLASGGRPDHVITIADACRLHGRRINSIPCEYTTTTAAPAPAPPAAPPVRDRLPVVRTQWGTIDLETYSRHCNCPMCLGIRQLQRQYRAQQYRPTTYQSAAQAPTPDDVIDEMLELMQLRSADVLCDLGCGDGRILIAAARRYGCNGVGVEIDAAKAAEARTAIAAAGLADRITILTGDAVDFAPAQHGVTALVTYLYPELLARLRGKFADVRVGASPFHEVPGIGMTQHGDVWIYCRP